MKKIGSLFLKVMKFIGWYIVFFSIVHFGLINIIFIIFGENSAIGNLSAGVLDIVAVVGGILFAFYQITKRSKKEDKV